MIIFAFMFDNLVCIVCSDVNIEIHILSVIYHTYFIILILTNYPVCIMISNNILSNLLLNTSINIIK